MELRELLVRSDAICRGQTRLLLLIAGMMLLMFSMAFKVSAAPFHFWTPDVYDGAPTVFTSFMATIVKVAVFIAFIRLFDEAFGTFAISNGNYGLRLLLPLPYLLEILRPFFSKA